MELLLGRESNVFRSVGTVFVGANSRICRSGLRGRILVDFMKGQRATRNDGAFRLLFNTDNARVPHRVSSSRVAYEGGFRNRQIISSCLVGPLMPA